MKTVQDIDVNCPHEGRATAPWVATGAVHDLPDWVSPLMGSEISAQHSHADGIEIEDIVGSAMHWRSVRIPNAAVLDHAAFTAQTSLAYSCLLNGIPTQSIARIWNFIPGINDILEGKLDRYMAFNGGRFNMYRETIDEHVGHPAASGVGHSGTDLVLHVLHGVNEVRAIDNLRQIAPSKYSEKFGPRPPAFSRASLASTHDGWWLFVSGTASVVGEESVHDESLEQQISETMHNLELVRTASSSVLGREVRYGTDAQWRIYMPCTDKSGAVRNSLVHEHGAVVGNLEFRKQALCRPELLVEIECAVRVGAMP